MIATFITTLCSVTYKCIKLLLFFMCNQTHDEKTELVTKEGKSNLFPISKIRNHLVLGKL